MHKGEPGIMSLSHSICDVHALRTGNDKEINEFYRW